MIDVIALILACAISVFAGFLYGLWWTQHKLDEAREEMEAAIAAYDRANEQFANAIRTFDEVQELCERVERNTGIEMVPIKGRIS
jgi:cobalamin biosynthesis protein CbiD